jgi:hypothetical protein
MQEALELLVSGGSQEALEPCVAAGVVGGAPAAARGTAPAPSVAYATPVVDVRLAYVFATPFVYGRRDGTTSAVPSIDAAQAKLARTIVEGSLNTGNAATLDLKWATKYHRVRGVHVTPTVFLNGIEAPDVSSGWDADQWAAKIADCLPK